EKLHDQISIIRELSLKTLDAMNSLLISLGIYLLSRPLHADLIHPPGIVERKFAGLRNFHKIAVQKRISHLFLIGLFHGNHLEKTRINVLDDFSDQASFS